jgi:hypothetical protein
MDGNWLVTFADQILFGNAVGAVLIFLTSCFLGKRASNIGIAAGFAIVCAYFIEIAWPIDMPAIHAVLTGIAYNCLLYGCVWIVVARGAQFLGLRTCRFIKARRSGGN